MQSCAIKLADGRHAGVAEAPRPSNGCGAPHAPIETGSSRARDGRARACGIRTVGSPMRVLYCTDTYPPQINGVSIVTALSVAGLSRRGWSCAVVAPRYPGTQAPWTDGIGAGPRGRDREPAKRLRTGISRASARVRGRGAVRGLIQRFRPHLVHCETEFTVGRMGQRAAAAAGMPVVVDLSHRLRPLRRGLRRAWLRRAVTSYLGGSIAGAAGSTRLRT